MAANILGASQCTRRDELLAPRPHFACACVRVKVLRPLARRTLCDPDTHALAQACLCYGSNEKLLRVANQQYSNPPCGL
jgi:hypothetical protein